MKAVKQSAAMPDTQVTEPDAVRERYARRAAIDPRYSLLDPAALLAWQERQRAIAQCLRRLGFTDVARLRLLEVGSGAGANLLEFLRLGFAPESLAGIELLPERHAAAQRSLPAAVQLTLGDATAAPLPEADVVFQATVFSSLLDDAFQQRLADAMWRAAKPGGGVLWYDFTVNNPRNPDVRGVPLARVRQLFPHGVLRHQRLTLAPPVARAVVPLWAPLYTVFNAVPLLRTHLLCWVAKP